MYELELICLAGQNFDKSCKSIYSLILISNYHIVDRFRFSVIKHRSKFSKYSAKSGVISDGSDIPND